MGYYDDEDTAGRSDRSGGWVDNPGGWIGNPGGWDNASKGTSSTATEDTLLYDSFKGFLILETMFGSKNKPDYYAATNDLFKSQEGDSLETPTTYSHTYSSEWRSKKRGRWLWKTVAAALCAGGVLFYAGVFDNKHKAHNVPTAGDIILPDYSVSQYDYMITKGGGRHAYRLGTRGEKIRVTLPDYMVVNVISKESDERGEDIYYFEKGTGRYAYYINGRYLKKLKDNYSFRAGKILRDAPHP